MNEEPISVRVARAKGCEPVPGWGEGEWECGESGLHGDADGFLDYLTPAASFALLAEMGAEKHVVEIWWPTPTEGYERVSLFDVNGSEAPTLEDAIALAWLAATGAA